MKRLPERFWAWLRLSGFLLALTAIGGVWQVRRVSAELSEHTLQIGRQLESWKDPQAGTTTLELNGQRLSITSVSSEASIETILDRFTSLCSQSSGGVTEQLEELGERVPEVLRSGKFGVFRTQTEHEGTAACFAREGEGGFEGLFERIEQLVDTGDFAALGQLRYVFARQREGSSLTHVVTVSSLSSLPLVEMFPQDGDAPGRDVLGARPLRSRRLLSAALDGSKQAGSFYDCDAPAPEALRSLDAPLRAQGFVVDDLAVVADRLPIPARVYVKSNDIVMAMAEPQPGGQSRVSTFRLANGGFVRLQP